MKKDEIKVLIDSEEKFNKAKSLLLEFDQDVEVFPEFGYRGNNHHIYFNSFFDEWCLTETDCAAIEEQVTLDQLREILSVESTQKMSD
jgi:hypothetical protein